MGSPAACAWRSDGVNAVERRVLQDGAFNMGRDRDAGEKLMLDRCRNLVQHPNQPRPTAAEATDEDDEARAFYHHTHPPGYRG